MNIIAADVGGTKTRLLYASSGQTTSILNETCYASTGFDDFEALLQTFITDSRLQGGDIDILMLALPGPVSSQGARLTNLPWIIEKQVLKDTFGIPEVFFINDFQASALGTLQLDKDSCIVLNRVHNTDNPLDGNKLRVAVGAGTGLGVAWLQENEAGTQSHASEGGHMDFAPADATQLELLRYMRRQYEHVSYERLLSGSGLVSLYRFFAGTEKKNIEPGWISRHAIDNADAGRALSTFVQIYGAYIGNIAMLFKPNQGIYITGGIAAKISDSMQSDDFLNAYRNKGRMRTLVEQVPVYLVTEERVGVLGALSEAVKIQQVSR